MYYHRHAVLCVLAAVPLAGLAMPHLPLWDDMRLKHTWKTVPANWECLGPPPASTTIDLHIALKPHRENALNEALYEVSSPGHPKYGAHLSKEQVAELVAPHTDTLRLVNSWLEHHNVSSESSISMTHGGGWLTVTAVPVSQADDLLGASYKLYRHTGTNETILRTVGYALPAALHSHIQSVAPTTYFAPPRTLQRTLRKRSREEAATKATSGELVRVLSSRDGGDVAPNFLRWLYKTIAYVPAATGQNLLGVAVYLDQYASHSDLMTFMAQFRTDVDPAAATFTVVEVDGGVYDPSQPPGDEASLDVQYAMAMAYPTPQIYYSIGGLVDWLSNTKEPSPGDSDLEWLNYMLSQPNIPQTISISFVNEERELPAEYATVLCNLFAQLGARGVSVLVASGDDGVGLGDCKDASGRVQFAPTFPASCPWVTSVGGTTRSEPEVAASLTGGGFSTHFPRPRYQDGAVTAFLQHLGAEYTGLFNPKNRGVPDISAQALNFQFVSDNEQYSINGTSCAAPTVAGIISLLNDFLLSNGKPPLGFLNPWLYGRGLAGLNDIISGSNPGCNTDGFSAREGWDPVTGLGTPDFEKLQRKLIMGVKTTATTTAATAALTATTTATRTT